MLKGDRGQTQKEPDFGIITLSTAMSSSSEPSKRLQQEVWSSGGIRVTGMFIQKLSDLSLHKRTLGAAQAYTTNPSGRHGVMHQVIQGGARCCHSIAKVCLSNINNKMFMTSYFFKAATVNRHWDLHWILTVQACCTFCAQAEHTLC